MEHVPPFEFIVLIFQRQKLGDIIGDNSSSGSEIINYFLFYFILSKLKDFDTFDMHRNTWRGKTLTAEIFIFWVISFQRNHSGN